MEKHREIKWQGRSGQGVVTAATVLAEVLAREGKYVQAFPQILALKHPPSVQAFLRLSDSPIKLQSGVEHADAVILMDVRLLLNSNVKENTAENATYIVNTARTPEFIKEKLDLSDENMIYTLDADTIAREATGQAIPNIPLMTILVKAMNLLPADNFQDSLKKLLALRLSPELMDANIATIQRALDEVHVCE